MTYKTILKGTLRWSTEVVEKTFTLDSMGFKTAHLLERYTVSRSSNKVETEDGAKDGMKTEKVEYSLVGDLRKYGHQFKPYFETATSGKVESCENLDDLGEGWKVNWHNDYLPLQLDENRNPVPIEYEAGWFFTDRQFCLDDNFLDFLREHPWVIDKNQVQVTPVSTGKCVPITVKPDAKTFKEIWDFLYEAGPKGCPVNPSLVRMEILSVKCLHDPQATDWLGIRPFLKNSALFYSIA